MIELLVVAIIGSALLIIVAGAVFNKGFRDAIFTKGEEGEFILFGVLSAKGAIFVVVLTILITGLLLTLRTAVDLRSLADQMSQIGGENSQLISKLEEIELNEAVLVEQQQSSVQEVRGLKLQLQSCSEVDDGLSVVQGLLQTCRDTLDDKSQQLSILESKNSTQEQIVFVDILNRFVEQDVGDTGFMVWVSDVSLISEKVDIRFKRKGESAEYKKLIDRKIGRSNNLELDGINYDVRVLGADPARNSAAIIIRRAESTN